MCSTFNANPAYPETDHTFPTDARHRSEELLRDSAFKPEYHFQVFARVAHGFAIRGNPDVPHESELCARRSPAFESDQFLL